MDHADPLFNNVQNITCVKEVNLICVEMVLVPKIKTLVLTCMVAQTLTQLNVLKMVSVLKLILNVINYIMKIHYQMDVV
jgi:hypothetical protein